MEKPEAIPNRAREALVGELSRPGGLALLFMATALALVTIFVLPEWQLPAAWFASLVVLSLTAVWITMSALRRSLSRTRMFGDKVQKLEQRPETHLPKVVRAMLTPGQEDELILLLRPNRLFGQFMLVSIYYEDERGFELFVGQGEVANVQSDGAIQITVRSWEESYQSVRRALVEQNADTFNRLLVRPAPAALPGTSALAATLELLSRNEMLRRPGNG